MILVTGGAGVIDSRLVHGLVKAGHRVRLLTLPGDPYISRLAGRHHPPRIVRPMKLGRH